ncbi:archaeal proteasome endopeptidase complex subunit alpha [Halosimplex pelagicum]|uniref:Proteasome subunit alpha n=1 Tax=Halosimplex pelagicum TaxID=869886 RepID=A0A7D5TFA0_9EURY|nr:archaeal proteasome endopeptidase complex subunit alpha [Halosimplex pelagicum]QLH84355.1 archaeal proteasome endopeptidase complex subunit alpha [Halosimplex pelagicum]
MQSNDQRAYDRGVTVFSPDGRLYQVEYAREAVKRGSPAVGVATDDAVVFAAHARPRSPLMEVDSIEKVHDLDGRLGVATAGHVADARRLVDFGRQFAQRERLRYGEPPGVEPLAKAVADRIQESTQTGGTRPFGAALLVGGVPEASPAAGEATDPDPQLYEIDPSGTPTEWRATAVGRGSDAVRDHLEAEYAAGLDTGAGVSLALTALAESTEESPTAEEVDVAVLDGDGFDAFDRDRREAALTDAGLGTAS